MHVKSTVFLALVFGNFGVLCGGFSVIALMPPIIAELHLSPVQGGLMISVYALTYTILAPLLGWLATRWSYRLVLTGAVAVACLGIGITAVANGPFAFF